MSDNSSPRTQSKAECLRRNCIWQRAKGTSRDNGYPYHKHVPDCDICQGADRIDELENANKKRLADTLRELPSVLALEEQVKELEAETGRHDAAKCIAQAQVKEYEKLCIQAIPSHSIKLIVEFKRIKEMESEQSG